MAFSHLCTRWPPRPQPPRHPFWASRGLLHKPSVAAPCSPLHWCTQHTHPAPQCKKAAAIPPAPPRPTTSRGGAPPRWPEPPFDNTDVDGWSCSSPSVRSVLMSSRRASPFPCSLGLPGLQCARSEPSDLYLATDENATQEDPSRVAWSTMAGCVHAVPRASTCRSHFFVLEKKISSAVLFDLFVREKKSGALHFTFLEGMQCSFTICFHAGQITGF
ncbi:hypothetical protein VPH35_129850 [Triticum aestivum]